MAWPGEDDHVPKSQTGGAIRFHDFQGASCIRLLYCQLKFQPSQLRHTEPTHKSRIDQGRSPEDPAIQPIEGRLRVDREIWLSLVYRI